MRPLSLAQVVAEKCLPRWRRMDAVMERLGARDEEDEAPGRKSALTPAQEREVVELYAKKRGTFAALGAQFGVSKEVIKGVLRRAREGR